MGRNATHSLRGNVECPITIHVPPLCLFHFLFHSPFIPFSFFYFFIFILGTYFSQLCDSLYFTILYRVCISYNNPSKQTNKDLLVVLLNCVSPYSRLNYNHQTVWIFSILEFSSFKVLKPASA